MGSGLLSPTHLAVVLAIVLIVFGPKRLPELGKALGHGMRSFKGALDGDEDDAPPVAPNSTTVPPAPTELAPPATHVAADGVPPASAATPVAADAVPPASSPTHGVPDEH